MTLLDFGCGPGFFTTTMADLAGKAGHVYAVDLQAGMLKLVKSKVKGSELASRITLHQCQADNIGLSATIDFALAFYVVHEIPDQQRWFGQIAELLRPAGSLLIVEPKFFHVSKADFQATISTARTAGLEPAVPPHVFLSQTALLSKPVT